MLNNSAKLKQSIWKFTLARIEDYEFDKALTGHVKQTLRSVWKIAHATVKDYEFDKALTGHVELSCTNFEKRLKNWTCSNRRLWIWWGINRTCRKASCTNLKKCLKNCTCNNKSLLTGYVKRSCTKF